MVCFHQTLLCSRSFHIIADKTDRSCSNTVEWWIISMFVLRQHFLTCVTLAYEQCIMWIIWKTSWTTEFNWSLKASQKEVTWTQTQHSFNKLVGCTWKMLRCNFRRIFEASLCKVCRKIFSCSGCSEKGPVTFLYLFRVLGD